MWRCVLVLLAGLLSVAPAAAEVSWTDEASWEETLAAAQAGPERRILLYFTAAWCAPCRLLEKEVFHDPAADSVLAPLLRVRLHVDQPTGGRQADRHAVTSVPTFILCEADGREIDRTRGYRNRDHFLDTVSRFLAGEGTVGDLQARLAEHPGDPRLEIRLGLRHAERLELEPAAALLRDGLEHVVALAPDTAAAAYRALADVESRRGRPGEAVVALETLLAGWPEHPYPTLTLRELSVQRRQAGDTAGALGALRDLLALRPDDAEAADAFVWLASDAGLALAEAERIAREAVDRTGRDPAAMSNLARVLARRESFPEALLWIKRAEKAEPDEPRWTRQREAIHRAATLGD